MVKREVNCAHNEKMRARKERKKAQGAARQMAKEQGEDTLTKSDSSDEEEKEGEVTPPSLSSTCITPNQFSEIVGRQVGITIIERWSK
jgi:uncharacterized membrane protein YkoI